MQTPKKILNDPKEVVPELIDGLVDAYHGKIKKLEGAGALVKTRLSEKKVGLLIGGGSGPTERMELVSEVVVRHGPHVALVDDRPIAQDGRGRDGTQGSCEPPRRTRGHVVPQTHDGRGGKEHGHGGQWQAVAPEHVESDQRSEVGRKEKIER